MGVPWYSSVTLRGEGILVPLTRILDAWKSCNQDLNKKYEKNDDDHEKYNAVRRWIKARLAENGDSINVQILENRFVFLAVGIGLKLMKAMSVPATYDIEFKPMTIWLDGTIEPQDIARLMKAARSISPTQSKLMFKAGNWSVISCFHPDNLENPDNEDDQHEAERKDEQGEDMEDVAADEEHKEEHASKNGDQNADSGRDQDKDEERQEHEENDEGYEGEGEDARDEEHVDAQEAYDDQDDEVNAEPDVEGGAALPEHPALLDSRLFNVTFKVGQQNIHCNQAFLAASNRMFSNMFLGEWRQVSEIAYEEFTADAFQLVLTFILVDTKKRHQIVTSLEAANEEKLSNIIQVADFVGETALESVCREYFIQNKCEGTTKRKQEIELDLKDCSEWVCFELDY